ncbi:MAG TPA: glycoside hydrolase family 9 protein [Flavisolibacter sp.]|nr:glycoside hydrolase family 9 protein [Flavisolibacter sp.]
MRYLKLCLLVGFFLYQAIANAQSKNAGAMKLNDLEYLEYQGVNVMLAHDFYPESHQGGVGVIQNGLRVATNGDIRLEPTPGQWQPTPAVGRRMVDKQRQEVSVRYEFPNEEINRKGFNPIIYPDLYFGYVTRVVPAGKGFRIIVDLDKPLPDEWIGKVGFNFELFPGILFGKSYYMDDQFGIFPRQANGPMYKDDDGETQIVPMAKGKKLTVAPESDRQRMIIENVKGNDLQLLDGRGKHNNGWFVVRSLVPKGATKNAIEWLVTPNAIEGWKADPVVQVSQVGYHPSQQKLAVIELDKNDNNIQQVSLLRVGENGGYQTVLKTTPKNWGKFLRYNYLQFDFTSVQKPGMYIVKYGKSQTEPFQISSEVFERNVWQPTLEYFLPAQMCHMRVNERYRVWHNWCHLDDARMAPIDSNHFDGYIQGNSTLTKFKGGDNVPGLDRGGWHDAGDFDLRVESQAETVQGLGLAYEEFGLNYDATRIDEKNRVVEIQEPDGKPDALQQMEHGLISIIGGYKSMGRLYRGIIEPTKRQYVYLGDASGITDNIPFTSKNENNAPAVGLPGSPDDRWVFTEENPNRELGVASALATASRVLKGYNDTLASQSLQIAEELWNITKEKNPMSRVEAAVELFLTTKNKKYSDFLLQHTNDIANNFDNLGWIASKVINAINDNNYKQTLTAAANKYYAKIVEQGKKTPYGVPYEPNIWGAGWTIQNFGFRQYYLHKAFPQIFPVDYMLNAMNFILGCHPGSNTASFVSGVGAKSTTTAYGFNRADWSYIPGGSASGTALIRPDFPELLTWPFLWQQTEYVLGGGTTDYLFLILAADHELNKKDSSAKK